TRTTSYVARSTESLAATRKADIVCGRTSTAARPAPPAAGASACALKGGRVSGTGYVYARLIIVRVQPTTRADPSAPTRIAICWWCGVEPTKNSVFHTCWLLPAFGEPTPT